MELTFFGLTPDYRLFIFNQIHEIVFHGQGGYTWDVVYNMPLWLRTFTYNKISEFYKTKNNPPEEDIVKKSIENLKLSGNVNQQQPPTYITKASKK